MSRKAPCPVCKKPVGKRGLHLDLNPLDHRVSVTEEEVHAAMMAGQLSGFGLGMEGDWTLCGLAILDFENQGALFHSRCLDEVATATGHRTTPPKLGYHHHTGEGRH